MNKIPLAKPYFTNDERIEVDKVLSSGWVSQGNECGIFENMIKDMLNVPYVISVSNCTSALHLSLLALGIDNGDEVIVADFSYPATGLAVLHAGGTPRFCDVDLLTYNIKKFERMITPHTKAVIPVHTFGNPCEIVEIVNTAKSMGLHVIEDAACAFGAKYYNKYIGTWGDIGCFSFHARKGITTGEGGVVVTHNKDLADTVRKLSTFGVGLTKDRVEIPSFEKCGYNYKMSDISAAIGVAQIKKLPEIIKRKKDLAKIYDDLLISKTSLLSQSNSDGKHIYQSYVAATNGKKERDNLINFLRMNDIESTIGTYAQHIQPVFKTKDVCRVSKYLFDTTIALPMYYELSEDNIYRVVDVISKCH